MWYQLETSFVAQGELGGLPGMEDEQVIREA